jgi:hypothetical protein
MATDLDRKLGVGLVVVWLVAIVVLLETGKNPASLLALYSGPAMSGLLGVLLVRRTSQIQQSVESVAHQTNGRLTDALARIQDGTDTNGDLLRTAAAAGGNPPATAPAGAPAPAPITPTALP